MSRSILALVAAVLSLAAGCDIGAREVDYRPSRGISADIAASHATGATSTIRGRTTEGEPVGAIPWQADQSGP